MKRSQRAVGKSAGSRKIPILLLAAWVSLHVTEEARGSSVFPFRESRGPSSEGAQAELDRERVRIRDRSMERESLAQAYQSRVENLLKEAKRRLLKRNYDGARRFTRQVLILNPHHEQALSLLAKIRASSRGKKTEKGSFEVFREEVPHLNKADQSRMIGTFLKRSDELFGHKDYDGAVEELERVFVVDPLNPDASRRIDRIKKRFIREKKKEWKGKLVTLSSEFSERMAISLETVKDLIREGRFPEAKVMLNRMAFLDPKDKTVRKLMRRIQTEEGKQTGGLKAA